MAEGADAGHRRWRAATEQVAKIVGTRRAGGCRQHELPSRGAGPQPTPVCQDSEGEWQDWLVDELDRKIGYCER